MIRAVLDTNVLVSGTIHPAGPSRRIITAWLERRFTLLISPLLIAEFMRVLRYPRILRRYSLTESDIRVVLIRVITLAELVDDPLEIPSAIEDDPADNVVLACAETGRADYIVSGDDHLLELSKYKGIPVVTPRVFSELL